MVVWVGEVVVGVVGGTMEILFGDPVLWSHVFGVMSVRMNLC